MERLTVSEAARRLGVTPDAVRQRIRRDSIQWDKDEDGRYHVYLTPQDAKHDDVQNALVDQLKDENAFLRRELERKDALLLNMTEVMKAINPPQESPPEPPESPSVAAEPPGKSTGGQDRENQTSSPEPERRSWWQRWFGSEQ
jgi:hypothetical protein